MPKGTRVLIKTDGKIDKSEKDILVELAERNEVLIEHSVPFYYLQNHISDVSKFIKKYVYPGWPGIYGLHLQIVKNRKKLASEWKKCRITIFPHGQPMAEMTIGFYCPYNYSIFLVEREIKNIVDDYDHEEGHHIHIISGETSEFPAEFNRLWKIFIRMAMNKDVGEAYFDFLHMNRPADQWARTIKIIGKYKSAALMFFMVMNYFKADLSKSAKYMFESDSKEYKRFFYNALKKYPKKLTIREIWEREMFKLFNDGYLYKNVVKLRKKAQKYDISTYK